MESSPVKDRRSNHWATPPTAKLLYVLSSDCANPQHPAAYYSLPSCSNCRCLSKFTKQLKCRGNLAHVTPHLLGPYRTFYTAYRPTIGSGVPNASRLSGTAH